jgi:putative MATE family efflux protein
MPTLSEVRRDLLDAVRGTAHDYTQGSLSRALFLLAVPMVLEMAMESLFAVTDVFFVGRLGPAAIATVGLTESMMVVIYTVAMGLGIGCSAVIARRIGAGEKDEAARTAVQAIVLAAVISGALALVGGIFAKSLLARMGAAPDVLEQGARFTAIMVGGSSTVFLLFILNACFRAAGDPTISMRVLWVANGINIVLGPLLIFGVRPFPKLGLAGAAVATTLGRGIGCLLAASILLRGSDHLRVERRHFQLDLRAMWSLIRLSLSGTFQMVITSCNWVVIVRLVATFGSVALAGYTIAIRIAIFALLPAWGLANAASTLVGQSLGAKNPERAESAAWTASRYNLIFLTGVGLLFFVLARPIVSAFTEDAGALEVGISGVRILALGFPSFAFGMVLTQSFNGAGDTVTPTWINLGVFWVFQIPLAWFLTQHTGAGPSGLFYCVLSADMLLVIVSALLFRRGTWKQQTV